MSKITIVLLIILAILIAAMIALYFIGQRLQKLEGLVLLAVVRGIETFVERLLVLLALEIELGFRTSGIRIQRFFLVLGSRVARDGGTAGRQPTSWAP